MVRIQLDEKKGGEFKTVCTRWIYLMHLSRHTKKRLEILQNIESSESKGIFSFFLKLFYTLKFSIISMYYFSNKNSFLKVKEKRF